LIIVVHKLTIIDKKKATELRFKPYPPLGEGLTSLESRAAVIQALIDEGSHQAAIEKSLELIRIGLEGLKYLQT